MGSPFKRFFERLPGTGMIFNSMVKDSQGNVAFYVPAVTYACPPNTWNLHCTDVSVLKRAMSILLVFLTLVLIFNLMMPELIESILNGMIIGFAAATFFLQSHHLGLSNFEIFITIILWSFVVGAVCGFIALYFHVGRFLTKLTFANLLVIFAMEIFVDAVSSPYIQFSVAFSIAVLFHLSKVSFSVLLGGLLFIMSLSQVLKIGNLHRIPINNFYALTHVYKISNTPTESVWNVTHANFINYSIELNAADYALLLFYVVASILLTIRKENYFRDNPHLLDAEHFFSSSSDIEQFNRATARRRRRKCLVGIRATASNQYRIVSRSRRHQFRSNVINERSPLISHWLASDEGDDEVFESPESNTRFLRALSSGSRERIDAIQNFDEQQQQ